MLRLVLDLWISGSQVTLPAGAGEVTAKVSKVKSLMGEACSATPNTFQHVPTRSNKSSIFKLFMDFMAPGHEDARSDQIV